MKENLRDCLKELILFNDPRNTNFEVTNEDGKYHKATIKDLQELNLSDLYFIADLLGMSDLYLKDGDQNERPARSNLPNSR